MDRGGETDFAEVIATVERVAMGRVRVYTVEEARLVVSPEGRIGRAKWQRILTRCGVRVVEGLIAHAELERLQRDLPRLADVG